MVHVNCLAQKSVWHRGRGHWIQLARLLLMLLLILETVQVHWSLGKLGKQARRGRAVVVGDASQGSLHSWCPPACVHLFISGGRAGMSWALDWPVSKELCDPWANQPFWRGHTGLPLDRNIQQILKEHSFTHSFHARVVRWCQAPSAWCSQPHGESDTDIKQRSLQTSM